MAHPPLTPEAVIVTLAQAGLPVGPRVAFRPRTDGFYAYRDEEDRIVVRWHSPGGFLSRTTQDARELPRAEKALAQAGYETERATEGGGQHVVVRTQGES